MVGKNRIFQSTPPARGATHAVRGMSRGKIFQSTPPARGATIIIIWLAPAMNISIHTPREGGDSYNPPISRDNWAFQSTPPARGATMLPRTGTELIHISIHTPREGGDALLEGERGYLEKFQSTPPARGATASSLPKCSPATDFNPHPPRGGRLRNLPRFRGDRHHFNPHPPRGGRLTQVKSQSRAPEISIHTPREGGDCRR